MRIIKDIHAKMAERLEKQKGREKQKNGFDCVMNMMFNFVIIFFFLGICNISTQYM